MLQPDFEEMRFRRGSPEWSVVSLSTPTNLDMCSDLTEPWNQHGSFLPIECGPTGGSAGRPGGKRIAFDLDSTSVVTLDDSSNKNSMAVLSLLSSGLSKTYSLNPKEVYDRLLR